ncbi:MAG: MBL fold metallo-hydrolase [Burkholderiales bacterium]|jgi:L-ascorbate metabolism protein UlaG (beta-lactamase superfamily)|nr:MBL fold metallo-hydrolase [Burkholderiales bacterium]
MSDRAFIKYYGWSAIELNVAGKAIFFDPFYRPYCGVQWYDVKDFTHADLVCVTHGHEEHFLDVPDVLRASQARVVATPAVCRFLERRNGIAPERLMPAEWGASVRADGVNISLFPWKHRDLNLLKAMTKAVFRGNTTQLSWAWSSATNAPFYSGYTGFHVELPSGMTVLNYNEGFNTKMTAQDLAELRQRFPRVDVLLAGMQLFFIDDVVRGVQALQPKMVYLYPPHEHFHKMMEAESAPWADFASAIRRQCPGVEVVVATPGTVLDLADFSVEQQAVSVPALRQAA